MSSSENWLEGQTALSQKINVATMPAKGIRVTVEANDVQRGKLQEIYDIAEVKSLRADLHLTKWQREGVRVSGPLKADLIQSCVATLEPVPESIDVELDAVFVPDTSRLARRKGDGEGNELIVDPEGPDAPETFDHPWIDVGAIVEEFFILSVNPYPRAAEAADMADRIEDDGSTDEKPNPFAALAKLKDKL